MFNLKENIFTNYNNHQLRPLKSDISHIKSNTTANIHIIPTAIPALKTPPITAQLLNTVINRHIRPNINKFVFFIGVYYIKYCLNKHTVVLI